MSPNNRAAPWLSGASPPPHSFDPLQPISPAPSCGFPLALTSRISPRACARAASQLCFSRSPCGFPLALTSRISPRACARAASHPCSLSPAACTRPPAAAPAAATDSSRALHPNCVSRALPSGFPLALARGLHPDAAPCHAHFPRACARAASQLCHSPRPLAPGLPQPHQRLPPTVC
jgi:hypothetical protein